jgi:hypothetical protein
MSGPITPYDGARPIGLACDKCGAVHDVRRCQGHVDDVKRAAYAQGGLEARRQAKGVLRQCRHYPRHGQAVCDDHGGDAPQNLAAAEVRTAEARVRKKLGAVEAKPIGNYLEELRLLAGEVVGWKNKLAEHVAELDRLRYSAEGGGEQIRGEVVLFERALDRCANVLVAIGKLNIDERLVRLTQLQAALVARVLEAGLAEAGLSPDQTILARRAIARELRAIGAANTESVQ